MKILTLLLTALSCWYLATEPAHYVVFTGLGIVVNLQLLALNVLLDILRCQSILAKTLLIAVPEATND